MLKKPWLYFQDPFFNATKKSFKKAVKISTYTDAQLFAKGNDPFYEPLYVAYHPLHLALVAAYNTWKAQGGSQKGATVTVAQLLAQLSPFRIGNWDRAVQAFFAKGTAVYMSIFPKGHKIFQQGTILSRINAVVQLANSLTGKVGLSTTLTDVTTFSNTLNIANTSQTGSRGTTNVLSDAVETARIAACSMMFCILGQCIAKYPEDPSVTSVIFDLETVRSRQQTEFVSIVKADAFKNIAERKFTLTDIIDVDSDGLAELGYYLAAKKGDAPAGYTVVPVLAGKSRAITIDEFINDTMNKFLCVVNLSSVLSGHCTVDLI